MVMMLTNRRESFGECQLQIYGDSDAFGDESGRIWKRISMDTDVFKLSAVKGGVSGLLTEGSGATAAGLAVCGLCPNICIRLFIFSDSVKSSFETRSTGTSESIVATRLS